MRHRKSGLKLGRTSSHRKAMFRNMVTSLFKHDRIRTTDSKAKELRSWADHLITLAKKGDLHSRRQALSIIREKSVVQKLFKDAPERFKGVNGGYTRIVKLGRRPGDAAPVSMIALTNLDEDKIVKSSKKDQKGALKKKTQKKEIKPQVETDEGTESLPNQDVSQEKSEEEKAIIADLEKDPAPGQEKKGVIDKTVDTVESSKNNKEGKQSDETNPGDEKSDKEAPVMEANSAPDMGKGDEKE